MRKIVLLGSLLSVGLMLSAPLAVAQPYGPPPGPVVGPPGPPPPYGYHRPFRHRHWRWRHHHRRPY